MKRVLPILALTSSFVALSAGCVVQPSGAEVDDMNASVKVSVLHLENAHPVEKGTMALADVISSTGPLPLRSHFEVFVDKNDSAHAQLFDAQGNKFVIPLDTPSPTPPLKEGGAFGAIRIDQQSVDCNYKTLDWATISFADAKNYMLTITRVVEMDSANDYQGCYDFLGQQSKAIANKSENTNKFMRALVDSQSASVDTLQDIKYVVLSQTIDGTLN